MLYSSSRLAVLVAACLATTCQAVELFQVTTHLNSKDTSELEELKFSICLNEDVVNVVADQFIDFAQTISPEYSMLSDEVKALKDLVCNDHTEKLHPTLCQRNKPSKFLDPINPFSSVNLLGETFRISVREGQTAADLTDCFCSRHTCSYHQGKHIEEALQEKIAKAESKKKSTKEDINIKISSPSSKSKK